MIDKGENWSSLNGIQWRYFESLQDLTVRNSYELLNRAVVWNAQNCLLYIIMVPQRRLLLTVNIVTHI